MAAVIIAFLWVSVLLTADFGAAADSQDQCLVKLIVDLTLQVQEQSNQIKQHETRLKGQQHETRLQELSDQIKQQETRLGEQSDQIKQQETRLGEQSDQIKQQESRLQGQETKLQEQSLQLKQLQEQQQERRRGDDDVVSRLEDDVRAVKTRQDSNADNLTRLSEVQASQGALLKEQTDELRSLLRDRLGPAESSLEENRQSLAALNESQSQQGRAVSQQAAELSRLQDKARGVDAELDWITGNLTALISNVNNSSRARRQAAFTARYSGHSTIDVGSGVPLKFPMVTTNIGEGYSPQTGLFTAPYAGTYAFYGTLRSSNSHGWILLAIYKGQDTFVTEYTGKGNADPWDRGSGLGTVQLQQGDTVHVRQTAGSTYLEAGGLTSFSGMLLSAD